MTTQEAIEFLPLYAAADDSDYVRHYEPKQKQQKPRQTHRKAPETPFRMQLDEKLRKFVKRYGLTFLACPACASSSSGFLMIYSAYKLNKQGDNIQP